MRLLDAQYTATPFYGMRRMTAWLRMQGYDVNHKRVARLMRQAHLASVRQRRYRVQTTDSKHPYPVAANVLDRQFEAQRPNQKWVADMTYIPTQSGWLFLADWGRRLRQCASFVRRKW